MKKIYLLSGIVAMLATPVLAGLKYPDINVTGELRAKGVKTNNTADFKDTAKRGTPTFDVINADEDAVGKTRVRVNMNSKLSDGITAYLNLQYGDNMWGNAGSRTSLADIESALQVRHAYLTIDDITGDILPVDINLTLGRQGIGVLNRELVLYTDSINAKVAKATYNDLTVTGICALQTADTSRGTLGDTNVKIQGITVSYPLPVGEANLCGYYLRAVKGNSCKDNVDKNNVYGIKVDGSMEIASTVNYFFEYAKQTGSMTNGPERDASALRLGGGYKTEMPSLGVVAVEGSYVSLSGDDGTTAKDEDFTGILPNLRYFSAMAVEGVGISAALLTMNEKAFNMNASISPDALEGVTLGFGYTKFTAAKVAAGAKDDLGSEIDLTCGYKYNDKTNIDLTYARFSPGDATQVNGDPASMLKCQLVTKF